MISKSLLLALSLILLAAAATRATNTTRTTVSHSKSRTSPWIRGVNLGGWLVIERYIVPYQYALTDCHVAGDFCWYPGALSAPPTSDPNYSDCTTKPECKPLLTENVHKHMDYPIDEWHLGAAFRKNKSIGEQWLNYHFENFLTKQDLVDLKKAGVTHLRVPLPHWVLGSVWHNEPWIVGQRWKYFLRMCEWARELNLQVWPNLHTAPGSQNGFDNSGIENVNFTCVGWELPDYLNRTLDVLHAITHRIAADDLLDVVTGFGLLNEPFGDCDHFLYLQFINDGLEIARTNLGPKTNIYVSDKFGAQRFNDGKWWMDSENHSNTYLDSHYYHVFSYEVRNFDTKKHIELVCHPDDKQQSIESCCFQDPPNNTTISNGGVKRISTEWSAAFDSMPGELLQVVMQGIQQNGIAPNMNRTMGYARRQFLKAFVQAQIVAYEAAHITGLSDGWFFWNFKIEGGSFAEWDFLRGIQEGWVPQLANADTASQDVYGTCDEIMEATENRTDVVHPFPWGDEPYWRDGVLEEVAVVEEEHEDGAPSPPCHVVSRPKWHAILAIVGSIALAFLVLDWCRLRFGVHVLHELQPGKKLQYTPLDDCDVETEVSLSENSSVASLSSLPASLSSLNKRYGTESQNGSGRV